MTTIKKIFSILLAGFLIVSMLSQLVPQSYAASDTATRILGERNQISHYGLSDKIDAKIMEIMYDSNQQAMAHKLGTTYKDGKVAVYINLNPNQISSLPSGIEITARDQNILVAKMTIEQMDQTSRLNNVMSITLPNKAVTSVVSEGVSFSHADALQQGGITGKGVNVAIIDDGFLPNDPKIQSNIISNKLFDSGGVCSGDIACGATVGNSHGTAVAEIVKDMAPNANLMLYTIANSVDFDNAVDDAITNHAKIITASLGFPTAPGDGTTHLFRDGTSIVAKKINQAKDAGVFVTIAAGNEGMNNWKGTYSPSTVLPSSIGLSGWQSVMNFRPSAIGNQQACLPVNDVGDMFFATWNAWPTTTQDYDFFLYDSSMTTILAFSLNNQNPFNLSPIESFFGVNSGPSCLVVASFSSTENHLFHIIAGSNTIDPSVSVRSGSIATPADASGAVAVGAINQATDSLEGFSSSGPTDDNRAKPEICGPDNTSSDQSSLNPFFGTSAATPHVAGAAALLLEQTPSLTADQLKQKLISGARFNSAYSVDNLCGSGSGALFLFGFADTTPPVITLTGANPQTITVGGTYTELGATVTDPDDTGLTATIDSTAVNTNVIGSYSVTYNAVDPAGNLAIEVTRTVNVVADTTPPVITLTGDSTIDVTQNTPYIELGATVTDPDDTGLTATIDSTAVNTAVVGTYTVTYDAVDPAGNHAIQVTRTVNVVIATNDNTRTVPTETGTEEITPTADGGTITTFDAVAESTLAPEIEAAKPAGLNLPFGLFSFHITGVDGSADVTLTFSQNLPAGTQYWKVIDGTWTDITSLATISGNTITLHLTDGSAEDADHIANNGEITDPSGPVLPPSTPSLPVSHSELPIPSQSKPSLGGINGEKFADGLAINGKTFDISKFTSQIPQQALPLNKPATISVKEELQRGSPFWQHVMVFLNFGGKDTITGNADTWISIDKTDGVQVHDPNGFISHVSAGNDFTAYGLITTFKFTPVKAMTDSNVIVRVWDNQGRQNDAIVNGAILLGEVPKAPEPAKIPNYLHVYSNLKDADYAVESAGYIKPDLFAHISNSEQIWKASDGGHVLWFFDTKINQVAVVTYDAKGNMLDEKAEELVKATTILIGKDTSYAGNHLNRQNVDQMKQAQKDQEMRALITMESFGYPVYYSK